MVDRIFYRAVKYVLRVGIQYCREHEEVSRQQKSANRLPSDSIMAEDYNVVRNVITWNPHRSA